MLVWIAFAAWLVTPRIGHGYGYKNRLVAAESDINSGIKSALGAYKIDTGIYPNGSNGLAELVQNISSVTNWHGPYLDRMPADPWGNPYIYHFPGTHNITGYDLLSAGPDGKEGTADDIVNW